MREIKVEGGMETAGQNSTPARLPQPPQSRFQTTWHDRYEGGGREGDGGPKLRSRSLPSSLHLLLRRIGGGGVENPTRRGLGGEITAPEGMGAKLKSHWDEGDRVEGKWGRGSEGGRETASGVGVRSWG
ncbi:hypothetical protein TIFTF001_056374, partial [Ficus carica]